MNHYFIFEALLFILIIFLVESNNNVYKIPFGLINTTLLNDTSNTINNIFYTSIYINISLGTPPQIVPCSLNSNSQTFSVPIALFDKNKSSSFQQISKNEISYEHEQVTDGYNCKDVIKINDTNNKAINFILGTKYEDPNNIFGMIGLLIPNRVQFGVYPFFHSLRSAGYINSYSWTLII